MTSWTGSGLVSRNKEGTQIVLARFPVEGETLTSFGLTPSAIKTIAIPNDIQEWPTTALNGCTNLEKITTFGMPAKEATIVLSFGHELRNLTNLTFLRLPSTLQNMGNGFDSLDGSGDLFPTSLQSVSFQDCSLLQCIGDWAFRSCIPLVHLNLSGCSSLKSIGSSACRNDSSLVQVDLSGCSSLQSIGDNAFNGCTSLVRLDLSGCSSLQSIERGGFFSCSSLVHIDFSGCSSLQIIGQDAFYLDTSLVHLDLSSCSSLQNIRPGAFRYCTLLQAVILPATLTIVDYVAFDGNTSLKTVYWMGSGPAANIGSNAFPSGVEHVYNYKP